MTDKYYTPSIEEFHVGFEYEFTRNSDIAENWTASNIKDIKQIEDIHEVFHGMQTYALRVKYLDREDIIESGFNKDLGSLWFEGFNFYKLRKWRDNEISIYYTRHEAAEGQDELIFRGTIKNKSELSILMKQLGITPISKNP